MPCKTEMLRIKPPWNSISRLQTFPEYKFDHKTINNVDSKSHHRLPGDKSLTITSHYFFIHETSEAWLEHFSRVGETKKKRFC